METLYGNIFSSVEHLAICGDLAGNVNTYVARRCGVPVAVLLFRQEGDTIRVLNEAVYLPAQEVRRFAEQVFVIFPTASVARWHAIRTDPSEASLPEQRFSYSEDIIIRLPSSIEEYLKLLGKATRKNVKHHLSRVQRAFSSFRFEMVPGAEADEEAVRAIIGFNRKRFRTAGNGCGGEDAEARRLLALVKKRGMIGVARIDGEVCGGAICTRCGDNFFSHISSHDSRYDEYRLGTLCCFLSICESIRLGGREFHLLWGKYDYKYRLGGVEHALDDVLIYRSRLHYLMHADLVLSEAGKGCKRQIKHWLRDQGTQGNNALLHFMHSAYRSMRNRKSLNP